jgi:SulP family sulfate permease
MQLPAAWTPKLVESLRQYTRTDAIHDLIAGVTVGLVALPLAMAFAISSGVAPKAGIYTAIIAGLVVSTLGGSKFQVSGPTGAFVVVVSGIMAQYGATGLLLSTLLAGAILLFLGASGLGTAVKFIPRPVVIGFTNGIAVLIASTQLKDFFGFHGANPGGFIERMQELARNLATLNPVATSLAVGTTIVLLVVRHYRKRIPATIVGLLLGTLVSFVFSLPVETVSSQFGAIPSGLPRPDIPEIHFRDLTQLLLPALTIAMLGAIESLMSAVVADRMGGDKHNPNVELMAQGAGNLISPLFGGIPITGAIARTATNIRSGARSPLAGIVHALTLIVVLLFAAPVAGIVPLPVLAAILMVVAWNMGEWQEIPSLLRLGRAEIAVWALTFLLTVFADLTLAVELGMLLAALLFIKSVAETTTVSRIQFSFVEAGSLHMLESEQVPEHVAMFRIDGPFLFGMTDRLDLIESQLDQLPRVVILRLRHMTALDASGLHALEHLVKLLKDSGRTVLICNLRPQPAEVFRKFGFEETLAPGRIFATTADALRAARAL